MNKMPYRCFIASNGKIPIDKFSNVPSKDLHQSIESALRVGADAMGVLDKNVVLIDFDNQIHSDIALRIIREKQYKVVIRQSTRGIHILALDNEHRVSQAFTNTSLACGLKADIKSGNRNGLESLTKDGIEKEIIYGDINSIEELPDIFVPITGDVDFAGKKEGDDRNSTLYGYIIILSRIGFSKEKIINTLDIINTSVFGTPLAKEEFNTIVRKKAFDVKIEESYYTGKRFDYHVMAQSIINEMSIKKISNQLYVYQDGFYQRNFDCNIERTITQKAPCIKPNQICDVIKRIHIDLQGVGFAPSQYISFKNGIYDTEKKILIDQDKSLVVPNIIKFDYKVDAYNELIDKTLNQWCCGDKQIRSCLEELIGYCFLRENVFQKSFFLIGEKANGKSTFIKLLQVLLGNDNYATFDLSDIGDRFNKALLLGKLADFGDDISSNGIGKNQVSIIKSITSGGEIHAEFKGKDSFNFIPYCAPIFGANNIPYIADNESGAVTRRLVIIPFNAKFDNNKKDIALINIITTQSAMEYLIQLGVKGLHRALDNKSFTESKEMGEAKKR
jgi:putative DNA primase/helicase